MKEVLTKADGKLLEVSAILKLVLDSNYEESWDEILTVLELAQNITDNLRTEINFAMIKETSTAENAVRTQDSH